jgi:probable HAF family extracellular repeat protein
MVIKNPDFPDDLGVLDRDPPLSPVGANQMSKGIGRAFLHVAGLLLVAASDVSAQEYTLIELDTAGGTYSQAFNISENGTIAGWAAGTGAVIWDENGIVALGHPGGDFAVEARAVNDAGQVARVGEGSPQTYQGYSWESGSWTPLGVLPGHSESFARDVDSAGRIAGSSFILGQEHRAVMWDAGVLTDLGTLGDSSNAHGINEVGQVVGYSVANLPGGEQQLRGFLWEDGQMTALDPLPGDVATQAFDVNDAGDVVGSSTWYTTQFLSASQATLWRDGGEEMIDLGYVPAPPWSCSAEPRWHKSIARAINSCGQIVGEAMCVASGAPKAAFLWQDGVMYNLNDLIPAGSGWDLRSAKDINDAGQIVGYGNPRLLARTTTSHWRHKRRRRGGDSRFPPDAGRLGTVPRALPALVSR